MNTNQEAFDQSHSESMANVYPAIGTNDIGAPNCDVMCVYVFLLFFKSAIVTNGTTSSVWP